MAVGVALVDALPLLMGALNADASFCSSLLVDDELAGGTCVVLEVDIVPFMMNESECSVQLYVVSGASQSQADGLNGMDAATTLTQIKILSSSSWGSA